MIIKLLLASLAFFVFLSTVFQFVSSKNLNMLKINTSNPRKLKEFKRMFKSYGIAIEVSQIDLKEIHADHLTVILHKASQLDEGVFVEDTSLEVENADVGVNIRWLAHDLENLVNRTAVWTTFLACRKDDKVLVYKGEVSGKIVSPHSKEGFGFDPYFLPDGSSKTLAEEKSDKFNARALAVEAFIAMKPFAVCPAIYQWNGPWQEHDCTEKKSF